MSTTGKGASNLPTVSGKGMNAHIASQDAHSTDPKINPFQNVAWQRSMTSLEEEITYSPVTVQYGYNGVEHVFELQKQGVYQGAFYLMYRRGQINWQNPDNNGSYARFHDFEGYSSIDKVVYSYMNKDVVINTGEDLYFEMRNNRDSKFQAQKRREQNADGSLRSALLEKTGSHASSGIWVFVDLLSPFEKLRKQLPIIGFPAKVKIRVYFKPLQQCIVTDYTSGTPDVKIHEMLLLTNAHHFPEPIPTIIFNSVKDKGMALMYNTHEYENDNMFKAEGPTDINGVATGGNTEQTWSIDFRSIKNYVFEIKIFIRPYDNVKPQTYSNSLHLWESLITPDQWWLEDQGSEVTKKYEGRALYASRGMKDHAWAHPKSTMFIPSIFFTTNTQTASTTEGSEDNSYGGRQLNRYTNLKLKLHFKPQSLLENSKIIPGRQYHVNVAARIHNQIIIAKGDLRKFLL